LTNPQKLTEAALARALSKPNSPVSRQWINQLVKKSILQKDEAGLIDFEAAKKSLLENVHPSGKSTQNLLDAPSQNPHQDNIAPQPTLEPDQDTEITSFHIAKTLREAAEAQIARLKLAEMRGKFLIKEDFERYLYNAGRMLRDTLSNCARRVGAEVAGLSTAEECEAVIDREHRAALASFAQQLRHTLKIETESNPLNAPLGTDK
jgi:hypothetical protein